MCIGFCLLINSIIYAQPSIQLIDSSQKTSYRGLSVVDNNIIWVSGSNGTVGKSINGGKSWQWMHPKGYEKRDFRDIEAFDKNTAIIMAVAEPGIILKTKDGGKTWRKVFEDTTKGVFLDAIAFAGKYGYAIGDPIDQHLYLLKTNDLGEHWYRLKKDSKIFAANEAFFASSGANIVAGRKKLKNKILLVSGGSSSRLFSIPSLQIQELPIMMGGGSRGANAIALSPNEEKGMIVGGDFSIDTITEANSIQLVFKKGHIDFKSTATNPHGYKSSVTYISDKKMISCGTSGVDISDVGGINGELVSKESYHVVQRAKKGNAVYLAGSKGKIAKLIL